MKRFLLAILSQAIIASSASADPSIAPVDEQYAHIAIFKPGEKALLCPSTDTMMNARTAIFSGNVKAIISATEGQACLLGEAGSWGMITAAHRFKYARLKFNWLVATDIDTLRKVRLENPAQVYWAYSFNLRDRSGKKIEPVLQAAFN